jgi:NAD-dependent dihydropyrimidine dehydrogenase PreA subunit
MAGMFIDVQVEAKVAADPALAKKLVDVCPVNIFAQDERGALRIVGENLDECVLCELCIQAVPKGGVRVIKLYDDSH